MSRWVSVQILVSLTKGNNRASHHFIFLCIQVVWMPLRIALFFATQSAASWYNVVYLLPTSISFAGFALWVLFYMEMSENVDGSHMRSDFDDDGRSGGSSGRCTRGRWCCGALRGRELLYALATVFLFLSNVAEIVVTQENLSDDEAQKHATIAAGVISEIQHIFVAVVHLALAVPLLIYGTKLLCITPRLIARTTHLPRTPRVLGVLALVMAALFAGRGVFNTIAAFDGPAANLPPFPPFQWQHVLYLMGMEVLPLSLALAVTCAPRERIALRRLTLRCLDTTGLGCVGRSCGCSSSSSLSSSSSTARRGAGSGHGRRLPRNRRLWRSNNATDSPGLGQPRFLDGASDGLLNASSAVETPPTGVASWLQSCAGAFCCCCCGGCCDVCGDGGSYDDGDGDADAASGGSRDDEHDAGNDHLRKGWAGPGGDGAAAGASSAGGVQILFTSDSFADRFRDLPFRAESPSSDSVAGSIHTNIAGDLPAATARFSAGQGPLMWVTAEDGPLNGGAFAPGTMFGAHGTGMMMTVNSLGAATVTSAAATATATTGVGGGGLMVSLTSPVVIAGGASPRGPSAASPSLQGARNPLVGSVPRAMSMPIDPVMDFDSGMTSRYQVYRLGAALPSAGTTVLPSPVNMSPVLSAGPRQRTPRPEPKSPYMPNHDERLPGSESPSRPLAATMARGSQPGSRHHPSVAATRSPSTGQAPTSTTPRSRPGLGADSPAALRGLSDLGLAVDSGGDGIGLSPRIDAQRDTSRQVVGSSGTSRSPMRHSNSFSHGPTASGATASRAADAHQGALTSLGDQLAADPFTLLGPAAEMLPRSPGKSLASHDSRGRVQYSGAIAPMVRGARGQPDGTTGMAAGVTSGSDRPTSHSASSFSPTSSLPSSSPLRQLPHQHVIAGVMPADDPDGEGARGSTRASDAGSSSKASRSSRASRNQPIPLQTTGTFGEERSTQRGAPVDVAATVSSPILGVPVSPTLGALNASGGMSASAGSVFSVTITHMAAAAAPPSPPPPSSLSGLQRDAGAAPPASPKRSPPTTPRLTAAIHDTSDGHGGAGFSLSVEIRHMPAENGSPHMSTTRVGVTALPAPAPRSPRMSPEAADAIPVAQVLALSANL